MQEAALEFLSKLNIRSLKTILSSLPLLSAQKHFLWTIEGPDSSYSAFAIHIYKVVTLFVSNVSRDLP